MRWGGPGYAVPVPIVHVVQRTSLAPEQVLEAAHDFSDQRADMWPDVHVGHLTVHDAGETWADVTEGNPWPIGFVWERLTYDWSQPGSVRGLVTDSNIFKPGSTWEIRARSAEGGSIVEVDAVRLLKGKGWLLAPFFPLGSAARTVDQHLRHFLDKAERRYAGLHDR